MPYAMPEGTTRHHTGQQGREGTGKKVESRDGDGHLGNSKGLKSRHRAALEAHCAVGEPRLVGS
jgi:hypothetical protein